MGRFCDRQSGGRLASHDSLCLDSCIAMNLLVHGQLAAVLEDATFESVLNIYPEEELAKKPAFAAALQNGAIEFKTLKDEAGRILIPWQMFFLDPTNLDAELSRIERLRHKASRRLLSKRRGSGNVTSKRILDRLVRCQTYISENHSTKSSNRFCGSLKKQSVGDAVRKIGEHFAIDMDTFRRKNKRDALAYLIEKIESGGVNICQGVLTNKILPHLKASRSVYKNTSGFVIHDENFPFAFIPSEINPDEREGRQIFTLVFLVALIGLEAYEYQMEQDFKVSMLKARGLQRKAYDIATELLLPSGHTAALEGASITFETREQLSRRYKLTPTAVVVILKKRGLISATEYEDLLPAPTLASGKSVARTPSIELSVRKFNGRYAFEYINSDFASRKITAVQMQYLLFGAINKKGFKQYKVKLGL